MNNRLNSFISQLMSDTNSGRARWSASSLNDEYRLEMPSGYLFVSKKMVDEPVYELRFLNKAGIDQILCSTKTSQDAYGLMQSLYNCVQNSFSVTIESLISELQIMTSK